MLFGPAYVAMGKGDPGRRLTCKGSDGPLVALQELLDRIRAPLQFVVRTRPEALGRVHVPAEELAAQLRSLAEQLGQGRQELLQSLANRLVTYPTTPAVARRELAQRCLGLIERLTGDQGGAEKHAGTPAGGPLTPTRQRPVSYRRSEDDVTAALERLSASVQFAHGVGPRRAELLRKFGIETIEDLLYHLPFRYEDRRQVRKIAQLTVGEEASVIGELSQIRERVVGRAQRRIMEAVLRDETGLLGLTWYHHVGYFRNRYRIGQRCLAHGRVERAPDGSKRMVHPELEPDPDAAGQGILPVYGKPTTMSVGAMRKLVRRAIDELAGTLPSALPREIAEQARVTDLETALREVHVPAPDADVGRLATFATLGHRSLVFDELLFLQLGMALRRRAIAREAGLALPRRGPLTDRLRELCPFALTGAQEAVLTEIYRDMAQPQPMHRLVQGDVGSGKTIVALFAALVAIENGYQAAFMAPTELLAEQHFRTMSQFAVRLGIRAELLTGERTRRERARLYEEIGDGSVQLAVGTHALIQEGVRFARLGLGVVDEQHRFGVLQRAALRKMGCGREDVSPDILLMSATPIPRTLAMTVYGDLDVSIIAELPSGRKPVRTLIRNEAERQKVYDLVRQELQEGRQGYIVYPLVESSEKEDLRDATGMAHELSRAVFPEYRVGLVHGRMKAEEKDAVMQRFRQGDLQLLVSTTVIEVGVDVPNATIMVIEHAERFGLSQLHQLRGRVGRGAARALCVLIAPYRRSDDVYQRLKAMAGTTDGFRIAEIDLEVRGPGELLGTRQSGLPDFRVANLIRDGRVLTEAKQAAEAWLEKDPTLSSPESRNLRAVMRHRWAGRLGLAEIG